MIIDTAEITQSTRLSPTDAHQIYCGLDSCVTLEIFEGLVNQLDQSTARIYSFERALQAPYLDIMKKGILIDEINRRQAAGKLRERILGLQGTLNLLSREIWGKDLNPGSPAQLKSFFFEAMGFPPIFISQKGIRRVSCNRDSLEKLEEKYLYSRPFVSLILRMRDLQKQLQIFESEIDPDGRWRAAYNIAGTETGRPSSSKNAYGTGGNAQNIAPGLRHVFIADYGWKMGAIDLEQVEARDVGYICGVLFDEWKFLDNCESGDLHTNNAKLLWPEKLWIGTPKADRALADEIFYRDFSHRDMMKRGGHLTNYMGTPWTMAKSLKIPLDIAELFQNLYCRGEAPAFPEITWYWQWVAEQIQTKGFLTNLFGRRRHFFGRPDDDTTIREGIAFVPQSTTGDRMNLGILRIFTALRGRVQLLGNGFDSVLFQYRESEDEAKLLPLMLKLIEVELISPSGRRFVVPGEAKVGWNWGSAKLDKEGKIIGNPNGLVKWGATKPDRRQRLRGLDRIAGGDG